MIEDNIMTKKRFTRLIEEIRAEYSMSYMDCVLKICEDRELDPGDVNKLISPVIKDKIEAEALEMNMIKGGGNTLPV